MAQNHFSDVSSRAIIPSRALISSVAAFALLTLPLGCGDDKSSDPVDDAPAPRADAPRTVEVPPRADDAAQAPARAAAETGAPVAPASAPPQPSAGEPAASDSPPPAPTRTFAACADSQGTYGTDCDTIYVTMTQATEPRCVQLTLDNCGGYGRQGQGLSVDVPMPWRLASGSIVPNAGQCDLGVFYPGSDIVADASGTISWNESTRLPSALVLELTLERSNSASDTSAVDVVTAEPLEPTTCTPN